MDHQIELTHKFLDLVQVHPGVAYQFYESNKDSIDWVLDTWKKYRDELIKITDKNSFKNKLKFLMEKN